MKITVMVPGPLRTYCGGASQVEVADASSVGAVLDQLKSKFPQLHHGVRDEAGGVRRHINIFVNSDNTRDLQGMDTAVQDGDVVTILPAVSGG